MTQRKLLPYEHQLCEALKVTEEEYLDFLAAQYDYTQAPEQRGAIVRAEPASTIALILTVVGIIFQVIANLFFKPDEKTQRQRRQERFSPRFGFNTTQELAQYGDPINLVYCSTQDNNLGGVRVGTELVWSAMESYGSCQFMQVLLVLGAAKIRTLDPERFAFGQLPLKEVMPSRVWIYYDREGRVKYNDRVLGDGRDPTRLDGTDKTDDVCKIMDGGKRKEGFSQAFSPTSMNVFGIYSPIPINVDIQERRTSGRIRSAELGVNIHGGSWAASGGRWKVGDQFTLVFKETFKKKDNVAQEAAKDMRYQYVESLDPASTYKIGTAKFRLLDVWGEGNANDLNIDNRDVKAKFECIEAGRVPYTSYGREKAWQYDENDRERFEIYEQYLRSPYEEEEETGGGTLEGGRIGSAQLPYMNYVDEEEARLDTFKGTGFTINFMGYNYNFRGNTTVRWETDVQDRSSEDFKTGSFTIDRGGSIAYTRRLYKDFLADKPTISVKQLRRSYEGDLEDLRDLRDKITSGAFDEELQQEAKRNPFVQLLKDQIDGLQARKKDEEDQHLRQSFKKNSNNDGLLKAQGTDVDPGGNKHLKEIEKEIERLRERKDDFIRASIGEKRDLAVRVLRNQRSHFVLFGRTYAGGIRYVKERLADLKGERVTDRRGCIEIRRAFKHLIQEKQSALRFLKYVTSNWEMLSDAADDHFYTKCLVKYEEAIYQTVSSCDYVKLAIRCRIFRSISGRAKKYGEKEAPQGFKPSDNGIKGRIAMFKLHYKQTNSKAWKSPPVIFALRRGADQDNFVNLHFEPATKSKYEFKVEPINDMAAEILEHGQTHFCFIQNAGPRERFFHDNNEFRVTGKLVSVNRSFLRPSGEERGPVMTNEWDLFSTRSDSELQGSFSSGPEFTITAVTEQQLGSLQGKYNQMSMLALGVYSGLGMQDLRSVTAYCTEGKESYRINPDTGAYSKGTRSTSWAPDIFADTILDRQNGIGKYAKPEGVDWQGLALAKRFCMNNGLGTILCMDGVIADRTSWRQFWTEVAPYSLLEFARIGGRETLIPGVPVTTEGQATRTVPITTLFNQGNILEGSFKEEFIDYGSEVQDLIATVIYRETEFEDVFPRNASVTISRAGVNEELAIRQTFDLSNFVTRRAQAILYGKWLVNQRHWIKRGIEFKTFPTDSPISPGSYIVVDIGLNTWDQLTTGVVLPEGDLDVPLNTPIRAGTYSMLLYRSGDPTVTLSGVQVDANGRAAKAAPYAGRLFVLGTVLDSARVFRVAEVSMDEEGEVTVRATEYPCERSGSQYLSHVADFRNALFDLR